MTSKNIDTRASQIIEYQRLLEKKKAELEKDGLKVEEINKDKTVKHLNAEIRRTKNAIAFIENREKTLQESKKAKENKATKPVKEKKGKKTKKEAPKEEKSKKNKNQNKSK